MGKEYTEAQINHSRKLLKREEIEATTEYIDFRNLLARRGREIGRAGNGVVLALDGYDFQTVEEKTGLAYFVSSCFEKPMSLRSITLVDADRSRICFLMMEGDLMSFWGEKFVTDPEGREVYYVDIVGATRECKAGGLSSLVGRACLDDYRRQQKPGSELVILTRTQNPMMAGALRRALPVETGLYPLDAEPHPNWISTVNWLVNSGSIARNTRADTFFDANRSLIHFGAYGLFGDGSTWENMIREYPGIDWSRSTAKQMLTYLERNGVNLEECLGKGHAFILGAYLNGTKI